MAVGALAQAPAGSVVDLPSVLDARVSTTPDRARLIVDLSAGTAFALGSATAPDLTIAVDVQAKDMAAIQAGQPAGEGLVESFSVELLEEGRVRTWLRLAGPAKVQQAYIVGAVGDQPARLIVDLIPATMDEFAAEAALGAAEPLAGEVPEAAAVESAAAPAAAVEPVVGPPAPVVEVARPLIVLDPGHGGIDPGAKAPNGVEEKKIVLAFAKILQKMLVDTGRFDVALTRDDDSFLKLEDRVGLARQNKADLLISIHADSFEQEEVRGASIYTRDENATDVLDKVLAEKENRVDMLGGFAAPEMDAHVVNVLVDLLRRETRKQSYRAARSIVGKMQSDVRMRRFPLRKADFYVLQAPDVPSILLELGFLSNPEDITNLTANAWRNQVAAALATGITAYFDLAATP